MKNNFYIFILILNISLLGCGNNQKREIPEEVQETKPIPTQTPIKEYNFLFTNLENQTQNIKVKQNYYSFLNIKQPIVLINFLATWCPPCIGQIPHLNNLQKKYKENLYILGTLIYNNNIKIIDIDKFLSKDYMITGSGVKKHLDYYEFFNYYTFRDPNRKIKKVYIYDSLPKDIEELENDIILMQKSVAKEILGIDEDSCTDIALTIPNQQEIEKIKTKLILQHFDMQIIKKDDIKKAYENLFNYKGGLFLSLYLIALVTFMLILYQRYSMISSYDKKEIGILKALGWNINAILKLKLFESIFVAMIAFFIGFILAFGYVYVLNAPILKDIFLGSSNLPNEVIFTPVVDFSSFSMLFLFFMVPFTASILIPVWKIAVVDPIESLR